MDLYCYPVNIINIRQEKTDSHMGLDLGWDSRLDKNSLNQDANAATEYEVLLQKLESSIRQHISFEHQFKIEYEKLLNKAEEIDLENKILAEHIEKQDNK